MRTLELGPTLLIVTLVALTLAPDSGRSAVVSLVTPRAAVSYDVVATAGAGEMLGHVATLAADIFGVPLPPQVVLHLYPTPTTFAHGLVREIGLTPRVALELAGSAIGLAVPRTVFLLADGDEDDRVRLVAHEVMHLVQHELAGSTGRPAQWVMEGTAEWAALTLLDRLGATGVTARTAAARTAARRYLAAEPDFTPAIVQRPADFRRWQRRVGDLVAYQVAYALGEHLVAHHGLPAVVAYFRAFRDADDPATNFERAFGASTAEFTAAARAAIGLATTPPPS
jgi:hypothetical protein